MACDRQAIRRYGEHIGSHPPNTLRPEIVACHAP